jgi:hypothetical protein
MPPKQPKLVETKRHHRLGVTAIHKMNKSAWTLRIVGDNKVELL